ncbi:MAG: hypothetical protein V9F00_14665 [Nocardioides sp.]
MPTPGIPGIARHAAAGAICSIILRASKKRSTSWLTSLTVAPEPLAMRARREPSRILGLARSAGVIDWMIACDPVDLALVDVAPTGPSDLPHARAASRGSCVSEPILRICLHLLRGSRRG